MPHRGPVPAARPTAPPAGLHREAGRGEQLVADAGDQTFRASSGRGDRLIARRTVAPSGTVGELSYCGRHAHNDFRANVVLGTNGLTRLRGHPLFDLGKPGPAASPHGCGGIDGADPLDPAPAGGTDAGGEAAAAWPVGGGSEVTVSRA